MSEILTLEDLEFEVRRSQKRKTVGITVDRGGELILNVPTDCPEDVVRQVVDEKRSWIYTKLAAKELLLGKGRTREFVSGESLLYLGRSYRLKILRVEDGLAPLRLHHGWFLLNRRDQEQARNRFIQWYIEHGQPWIGRRVDLFEEKIGVRPGIVKVRDLGARWGSCGKNRSLNFHWRTILLPPRIVDYIVAHEMVHLREPHHTPEFWHRLERVMPDYPARKQWLAENGAVADL